MAVELSKRLRHSRQGLMAVKAVVKRRGGGKSANLDCNEAADQQQRRWLRAEVRTMVGSTLPFLEAWYAS